MSYGAGTMPSYIFALVVLASACATGPRPNHALAAFCKTGLELPQRSCDKRVPAHLVTAPKKAVHAVLLRVRTRKQAQGAEVRCRLCP